MNTIRRPFVVGVCPTCAGQGHVPDEADPTEFVECIACGGTGDLDEVRLRRAYDCGRNDALEDVLKHLGDLRVMVGLALDRAENPPTPANYAQLRMRIGDG